MTSVEIALTFSLRNTHDFPRINNIDLPLIDRHQSTSLCRTNQELCLPAYGVSQKNNDIGQAYFFSPLPLPPFLLSPSHLPLGLLFLLSPIFHCHKIKDGGYNNTNMNKVSPTQNTPALQANSNAPAQHVINIHGFKLECSLCTLENWYWAFHVQAQMKFFLECSLVKQ